MKTSVQSACFASDHVRILFHLFHTIFKIRDRQWHFYVYYKKYRLALTKKYKGGSGRALEEVPAALATYTPATW